jgi:hypothetical protein
MRKILFGLIMAMCVGVSQGWAVLPDCWEYCIDGVDVEHRIEFDNSFDYFGDSLCFDYWFESPSLQALHTLHPAEYPCCGTYLGIFYEGGAVQTGFLYNIPLFPTDSWISTSLGLAPWYKGATNNLRVWIASDYADSKAYLRNVSSPCSSPQPVPEPATLVLAGSGILGWFGFSRLKRKIQR